MQFKTPADVLFDIPNEWWTCADMHKFATDGNEFYPYASGSENVQIVSISEVEPPTRSAGVPPFKKYKLLPILFGFQSPECALLPVEVLLKEPNDQYRFKVSNGYHRYYASVAVGYLCLPVVVRETIP